MLVEIIPTEKGNVVLKTMIIYPVPYVKEKEWNKAVDEAIKYLTEHKLKDDYSKQFKRSDEV